MAMMTYNYSARDTASGKLVKADVQADSISSAAKLIKAEGLVPIDIKPAAQTGLLKRAPKVKAKDRVMFSRQLSTLINAGLPLVQALRSVAGQTQSKPLLAIISSVISDVESGMAFSKALAKYPRVFNQVFISLVAAGETSGTLDESLERLANQQEKDADIVSKVRGAMIYPLIVLLVMILVMVFMLVKVLPQVKTLYGDIGGGATLPLVTRILLWASGLITNYWYILIIILAVLAFITSKWARTAGGKRIIDKVKMRSWPINHLFMKMYMARFARTGSTLMGSGVPLIQMMDITGTAVDNVYIKDSLEKAEIKVRGGKSLGTALEGDPNFLDLVPNMLKIGEQSGSMQDMLAKAADYYEKELDNEIKSIQTIIEPVMMILMGIMAFVIVAAVLLPIYNLASQVGSIG